MISKKPDTSTTDLQLLTREDLCQRLQISKRTVSRLVAAGKFPPPIRLGHSIRWRSADIESWIQRDCRMMDRNAASG